MRTRDDLNRGNFWGWPTEIGVVDNYAAVFSSGPTVEFILNSFWIAIPAVTGTLLVSSMMGFALTRYRIPGGPWLLAILVAGNFVPYQILMIPVRELMVDTFHIYNTKFALILFHVSFQTGFATLFMRSFMRRVPLSLLETARLEGISELGIYWKIMLPLIRPAIAGLSVLVFTFVWNDYFWSIVLVHSDSARPMTAGVQTLKAMWLSSWHLIAAGSIVAAIPPVLLFLVMQKHFVTGLTAGISED
jgi:multiple sugar transport system permease protein